MDRLSDEALVDLILKGEKTAFGVLIKRYEKQIYSLAYRLTNNKDDAQDFAQEAFLKIYNNLDKYDKGRPFFPGCTRWHPMSVTVSSGKVNHRLMRFRWKR